MEIKIVFMIINVARPVAMLLGVQVVHVLRLIPVSGTFFLEYLVINLYIGMLIQEEQLMTKECL